MNLWTAIAREISSATGTAFRVRERRPVGGGCINTTVVVADGATRYFVKLNSAARSAMFAAEFEGLREIGRSGTLHVPTPVCWGTAQDRSFLVMEYLTLRGARGDADHASLGQRLAAMHRTVRPDYGWSRDNTIGSTPQPNRPSDDWLAFWRDQRLGFQLELVAARGGRSRLFQRGERLLDALPALLGGHQPPAALLHGDLWSGNYAFTDEHGPIVFDPAVYFGDRETDLAMTELFGGFPARFYRAYEEAYPLPPEYAVRKTLYNLYHVLNHFNLFGGGYATQAEAMIDALLAEVR